MAERETMTGTFEPTLDVLRMLVDKPAEYVVVNPVTVEARFKNGEVRRFPQEVRERIVRCRDCSSYRPGHGVNFKPRCEKSIGTFVPEPDGFCAWGEERED